MASFFGLFEKLRKPLVFILLLCYNKLSGIMCFPGGIIDTILIPFFRRLHNFGPFITAILTCILIVTSFVNLLVDSRKLRASIRIVSVVALLTSLAPLLINCYSVLGGAISLLLLLVFVISSEKEVG